MFGGERFQIIPFSRYQQKGLEPCDLKRENPFIPGKRFEAEARYRERQAPSQIKLNLYGFSNVTKLLSI